MSLPNERDGSVKNTAAYSKTLQQAAWLEQLISFGVVGLQLIGLAILLDYLLFFGTRVDLRLQWLVVGLLVITVRASQVWVLVLVFQVILFSRFGGPRMELRPGEFFYCFAALLLVFYASRMPLLRIPSTKRFSRWVAEQITGSPSELSSSASLSHLLGLFERMFSFIGALLYCFVVLTIAAFVLTVLPFTPNSWRQWLELSMGEGGVLWPGPTLCVAALGLWLIVRELAWRQMTKQQAGLYLRSSFLREYYSDLRMMVRRRLKLDRKRKPGKKVPKKGGEVVG